jgi:hypothetical protein
MDRRLFLTGMIALAGSAVATSLVQPVKALPVGLKPGDGILDELASGSENVVEPGSEVMPVNHRSWHRRRRRRRRVWRRYCRSYWRRGRRIRRCYRRRVWVWYWHF